MGPPRRRHFILLLLVLALGAWLRFSHIELTGPRLWDEGIYLQEARFFHSLVAAVGASIRLKIEEHRTGQDLWKKEDQIEAIRATLRGSPPIYGRLTHDLTLAAAMGIWGPDDPTVGARVTALSGTLCLIVLYLLARRLYGPRAALLATLLLAVSGYRIHYSRSTMAETTSLLFLLLAFYFYAGSRTRTQHLSSRALAPAALFLGISFTTHNRMIVLLLLFLLLELTLWSPRSRHPPPFLAKRLFVLAAFFALPLLAWEAVYYAAFLAGKHLGLLLSVPSYFEQVVVALGRSALWNYISRAYRPAGFLTFPYLSVMASGPVPILLTVAGLVVAFRRRSYPDLLAASWFLLPFFLYSITTAGLSRVYTVILPAAALLGGSVLRADGTAPMDPPDPPARRSRVLYACLALLVLLPGTLFGLRAARSRDGYARTAAHLRAQGPGKVIATNVPVLRAYLRRDDVAERPPASLDALRARIEDGYRYYVIDYNRHLYSLYQTERVAVMDRVEADAGPPWTVPNPFVDSPLTVFEANLYFWDSLRMLRSVPERGLDTIRVYDLQRLRLRPEG